MINKKSIIVFLIMSLIFFSGCDFNIFGGGDNVPKIFDELEDIANSLLWKHWFEEKKLLESNEIYTQELSLISLPENVSIKYAFTSEKPVDIIIFLNREEMNKHLNGESGLRYPKCGSTNILEKKVFCNLINKDLVLFFHNKNNESVEINIKAFYNF